MEGLLREVVQGRRPDLLAILNSPAQGGLTELQRNELRHAVTEEFCRTGLREDDEPNPRGLRLEELTDRLGEL
jgi:hypothetical protein